jgi:DNA-binding transcriptional ArsR family regulator
MGNKLRPTVWRTCRVIASETRLRLLWHLFEKKGLCISDLAAKVGISDQNASIQLRAINARGLIRPRRIKLKVFYHPEANPDVEHAEALLSALRLAHESQMSFKVIIRQATAFTHDRRILILRSLTEKRGSVADLEARLKIPAPSLNHHLLKLEDRSFVKNINGVYRTNRPGNPLGRALMKIAIR